MTTEPKTFEQRAFDTFAEGVRRPFGDVDSVLDFAKTFYRYEDFQSFIDRLQGDARVVDLLVERPPLGISEGDVQASPDGSLGAALRDRHGDFPLISFQFGGSPVQTFIVCHLLETAPLWNAVLDTDPDDDTRLLLLAFFAAQIPMAGLLALLAKNLSKVGLERFDRHDAAMASLAQGWTLGRRARPLLAADWKALIARPIDEVRRDFGISETDVAINRRCSAELRTTEPVHAEGVDIDAFLEAMGTIVLMPYGSSGFEAGQNLRAALVNTRRALELMATLVQDPELAARFQSRPRLGDVDFKALHALPAGTLGRVYGDHMLIKEFDPPPPALGDDADFPRFFTSHIVETHDVWHTVTGAKTDKAGECALHAFYTGQLRPLPVQLAYVARCILKTAIEDMDRAVEHMDAVARGWLMARQVGSLPLVDWRALFETPLADVRARFDIPRGGLDDVPLDTTPVLGGPDASTR